MLVSIVSAFGGGVLQDVRIKKGGARRGGRKQKRRDQCIAAALAVRGVERASPLFINIITRRPSSRFATVHEFLGEKRGRGFRFVNSNLSHELGHLVPELLIYFKMFNSMATTCFFPKNL